VQLLACGMPVSGIQAYNGCPFMWVAWMHAVCCMHMHVVGIHVAFRHAWRVYNASALLVAKLSYPIEYIISSNYFVHKVKSGKFYTI
jgi:hypothetical protein